MDEEKRRWKGELGDGKWPMEPLTSAQPGGKIPAMSTPTLSQEMARFFRVEIRNETHGGISPSTLDSSRSSLEQASDDVVVDWCDGERSILLDEISILIESNSGNHHLEDFLN